MTSADEPVRPDRRLPDPARTRSDILRAATREFARAGYDGARVEEIAARTRTTKRMIYYYFGGKEHLFRAVLERAYGTLHEAEDLLDVPHLDPVAAVRRVAEVTFDHHERHPDLVRLVGIENIHGGEHLAAARRSGRIESPKLDTLHRVLDAGRESGVFTADADAVDVHAMISAFCFHRVTGQHTFTALFDRDLTAPDRREHNRAMLGDMVVGYLTR
ncbi:TetR/AcrR family transcriptional regulator [Streptomyces sp. NPDC046860]|uniref:TetR/AcrR family transcriptional regulator n=1 Tax=Streptomyces sp. NPDC046860 TaxID=3154495 RepID=UPI0033C94CD3